ncbi:MAG: hypothetical protein V4584_06110 [Verrucomicrobiota bacterium]
MNAVLPTLEVRQVAPIELPRCEVVLPMPRAWFDEINALGMNVAAYISALVSSGAFYISEPRPREDFPEVWGGCLKPFRRGIPKRGETVRALIPMRQEEFDCLRIAAQSIKVSEHELALVIIARTFSILKEERETVRRHVEGGARASARVDRTRNQAPQLVVPKPSSPEANPEENTLTFHKCRHCPHRFKPWHSPLSAS